MLWRMPLLLQVLLLVWFNLQLAFQQCSHINMAWQGKLRGSSTSTGSSCWCLGSHARTLLLLLQTNLLLLPLLIFPWLRSIMLLLLLGCGARFAACGFWL